MPDFMEGLADGIEKSRGLLQGAMSDVAADMVLNPQLTATQMSNSVSGNTSGSDSTVTGILSGIREMVDSLSNQNAGIISIPVYLGNSLLDEVIVDAQQRQNLRSGGR